LDLGADCPVHGKLVIYSNSDEFNRIDDAGIGDEYKPVEPVQVAVVGKGKDEDKIVVQKRSTWFLPVPSRLDLLLQVASVAGLKV
jgi:hypothetical protein